MPSDLEKENQKLLKENERLTIKLKLAEQIIKGSEYGNNIEGKKYTIYLMQTNAILEKEYETQLEVIEQYQKHYSRYSHFYADLEKRMLQ